MQPKVTFELFGFQYHNNVKETSLRRKIKKNKKYE